MLISRFSIKYTENERREHKSRLITEGEKFPFNSKLFQVRHRHENYLYINFFSSVCFVINECT